MSKHLRTLIMFVIGCSLYVLIEIVYRGYSFRLMALSGGLIFVIGGLLNDKFSWETDLLLQCGIISALVTLLEAIIGNVDYYFLHLEMWDYTNLPFNYLNGKICLPFAIIWFFLGFAVVFLHDAITYYWMHEGERPMYYIFGKWIWTMPKRNCHEGRKL